MWDIWDVFYVRVIDQCNLPVKYYNLNIGKKFYRNRVLLPELCFFPL